MNVKAICCLLVVGLVSAIWANDAHAQYQQGYYKYGGYGYPSWTASRWIYQGNRSPKPSYTPTPTPSRPAKSKNLREAADSFRKNNPWYKPVRPIR